MAADRNEVDLVCGQLAAAVQVMMDPTVAQAQRIEAYNKSEQFKQTSPIVMECALTLSRPGQNQVRIAINCYYYTNAIMQMQRQWNPRQIMALTLQKNLVGIADYCLFDQIAFDS